MATPTTVINTGGTMAGGTLEKGADPGTPSISHLDVDGLFAALPDAYGLCAGCGVPGALTALGAPACLDATGG